jgi:hypothetical protein
MPAGVGAQLCSVLQMVDSEVRVARKQVNLPEVNALIYRKEIGKPLGYN